MHNGMSPKRDVTREDKCLSLRCSPENATRQYVHDTNDFFICDRALHYYVEYYTRKINMRLKRGNFRRKLLRV